MKIAFFRPINWPVFVMFRRPSIHLTFSTFPRSRIGRTLKNGFKRGTFDEKELSMKIDLLVYYTDFIKRLMSMRRSDQLFNWNESVLLCLA